MHKEIFIIDGARTAIGAFSGGLAKLGSVELGKTAVCQMIKRNKIDTNDIDELIFGNILQTAQGMNVSRQIQIASGIPQEKTSLTISFCLFFSEYFS